MLDVWSNLPVRKFPNYAAGTWGPPEADDLLAKDGRHWCNPSDPHGNSRAGRLTGHEILGEARIRR